MSIDFNIRSFAYPVAILRLHAEFEKSQWLSAAELQHRQEQRLRRIIQHAYAHVPYYRNLFRSLNLRPEDIKSVKDVHLLPQLTKEDVRRHYVSLTADNHWQFRPMMAQTTGTTGESVHFLMDKPSNVLEFVYYWRHWSWAGYRIGDRFAELASYFFLQQKSSELGHVQRGFGRLLLNSIRLSPDTIREYKRLTVDHRARFLKGLPSALCYFATLLQESGLADLSFRAVFSTGEMLLPSQRSQIEETFHCQVFDSYGHMERTVAISQCGQGRYHVNPEYGMLELLDRTSAADQGAPLDPCLTGRLSRGRIVGTSLHNMSMPLLRYDTGDLADFDEQAPGCPCGRQSPQVRCVIGRQNDLIVTPDGRVIGTLFLAFNGVPGILVGQFVQHTSHRLLVRIARSNAYTKESEIELKQNIHFFVGPHMSVEFDYLTREQLLPEPGAKFRAVVSRVAKPFAPCS